MAPRVPDFMVSNERAAILRSMIPPEPLWRARSDRGRRRDAAVSAAVFARLQSDRARVRETEGAAAQGRRAYLEVLWDTIGVLLLAFHPNEPANYFANSGYGQP